jgi:AP endonuclease-1
MSSAARPRRAAASKSAVKAESPGSDLSDLPETEVKPTKKSPRKSKVIEAIASGTIEAENDQDATTVTSDKKGKGKAAPKRAKAAKEEVDGDDEKPKKKPRVSKASIFPPTDLDPSIHPQRQGYPIYTFPELPAGTVRNGGIQSEERTTSMSLLIGAHTSIAGGPATALLKAGMLGANGLAMFVKSQRQWKAKDYEQESVDRFRDLMKSKEEGGEMIRCLR